MAGKRRRKKSAPIAVLSSQIVDFASVVFP